MLDSKIREYNRIQEQRKLKPSEKLGKEDVSFLRNYHNITRAQQEKLKNTISRNRKRNKFARSSRKRNREV